MQHYSSSSGYNHFTVAADFFCYMRAMVCGILRSPVRQRHTRKSVARKVVAIWTSAALCRASSVRSSYCRDTDVYWPFETSIVNKRSSWTRSRATSLPTSLLSSSLRWTAAVQALFAGNHLLDWKDHGSPVSRRSRHDEDDVHTQRQEQCLSFISVRLLPSWTSQYLLRSNYAAIPWNQCA